MLWEDFIAFAAELFRTTPEAIMTKNRARRATTIRFGVFMALRMRGWSHPRIVRKWGYLCHSSSYYGCLEAEARMQRDELYRLKVKTLAAYEPGLRADQIKIDEPIALPKQRKPREREMTMNEWGREVPAKMEIA